MTGSVEAINFSRFPLNYKMDPHKQPDARLVDASDPPDRRPCVLITEIILSGDLCVFDRGKLIHTGGKQVVLFRYNDQVFTMSPDYSAIRISIDPNYLTHCLWPLVRPTPEIGPQELDTIICFERPTLIHYDLWHLLQSFDPAWKHDDFVRHQLARQLLVKLMLEKSAAFSLVFLPIDRSLPKTAIGYFLEANFTHKLSVNQLAKAEGKSLTTFKRDFALLYKTSPVQWLINRRLEYAYFLIRYTEYSVTTIGQLSGFSQQAYFAFAYKSKFGISPLQSRLKKI